MGSRERAFICLKSQAVSARVTKHFFFTILVKHVINVHNVTKICKPLKTDR